MSILEAARSYYGLADTDVRKTDIYTNDSGLPMLVFELALSAEDFIAIGARMKNMQQPDAQPDTAVIESPTVEAMREAYNALSKAEKGRYGSFARYMVEAPQEMDVHLADGAGQSMDGGSTYRARVEREMSKAMDHAQFAARQVVHVDTPEEPGPTNMDAVWLHHDEVSRAQWNHASDWRGPECLIQWAMLTDEQKQKAKS